MKPHRRKKLTIIAFIATGLSVAIGLSLYALSNSIDLFFTPTQVAAGEVMNGQRIRVGGMVKDASNYNNTPVVLVGIFAIGISGLVIDGLLRTVERRAVPWRGKA